MMFSAQLHWYMSHSESKYTDAVTHTHTAYMNKEQSLLYRYKYGGIFFLYPYKKSGKVVSSLKTDWLSDSIPRDIPVHKSIEMLCISKCICCLRVPMESAHR